MAYNKKQHLQDNITAIHTAFELERLEQNATPEQQEILRRYSGFGGLKCILYPCDKPEDIEKWNASEQNLFDITRHLYDIIRQYSKDENECKTYVDSLHRSVLTAFYTPRQVTDAIAGALHLSGVRPNRIMEPSAGTGIFAESFKPLTDSPLTFYEKDRLTGKILEALYPEDNVYVDGFESIPSKDENLYDLVTSNIPFGDFRTFDPAFVSQNNPARKQASRTIHNYFFLKAVDVAREGGIIAFITSQGVMDSSSNTTIRKWLMNGSNLVSAIRLPTNLFLENANTRTGSDLVILQKNTGKQSLSDDEKAFIYSRTFENGYSVNNYFMDFSRIISTSQKLGKDQYGKPAVEFYYGKSLEELGSDLTQMIQSDCRKKLDMNLYNQYLIKPEETAKTERESNSLANPPLVSLYDLFGIPEEERTQITRKQKTLSNASGRVGNQTKFSLSDLMDDPVKFFENSRNSHIYTGEVEPFYKGNTLVLEKSQVGYLTTESGNGHNRNIFTFNPVEVKPSQRERIKDYIPLRDAYLKLYRYESTNQFESPVLRQLLNEKYKIFTEKHGDVNNRENFRFILLDAFGRDILSIEYFENGEKQLAEIFSRPVSFLANKSLSLENADEILSASLNQFGIVNMDYMTAISSKDEKELIEELRGVIYYNPLSESYEFSSHFISGNVIEKADAIEQYIRENPNAGNAGQCKESLESLRKATPEPVPFSGLSFNLGERWVPMKYYNEYVSHIFNTGASIQYFADLDSFDVQVENPYTIEIREKYSIRGEDQTVGGLNLLSHALLNTIPNITKGSGRFDDNGKEIRIPDTEAIRNANTRIDEIRSGFMDWLGSRPVEDKETLADLYNRKFNSRVKPQHDGKFQTFPDLQLKELGIVKPYNSQYDAIWMLKSQDGGIVDHSVGTGKTLTICITAYEMKRLKMAHKPMVIGLKSNIFALADTYSKAYPNAKMLVPKESDFDPENRQKLFNKIKNNNWDIIFLTHEQFFKIPQSLEIQRDIFQKELDSVTENLRVQERLKGQSATKKMLNGLQKRKENLAAKLNEIHFLMQKRKDDFIDFKSMGIDHLFVDESHEMKNLQFTTRYNRVAGLGNPQGSQKALNLLYAIRTIQDKKNKDLCATFLSGTIISNSLVELYLVFKYLRPRALEAQGIRTLDAWAAVYAKKTSDFEFSVTNEIKSKDRFRFFKNVPELSRFYCEIADVRTSKDIRLDKPENNIILYKVKSTPEQDEFQSRLIEFAKNGDGALIDRPQVSYEGRKSGRMLVVTDIARKISLDVRLVDPEKYHDHPDNKLSQAARNIADYYRKFNEQKGTQFVFYDKNIIM